MSRTFIPYRALPGVVAVCVVAAVVAAATTSRGATAPPTPTGASKPAAAASSRPAAAKPAAKTAPHVLSGFTVRPAVGVEPVPVGFPTGYTTGVPTGLRLHIYTGPMRITKAGTVISGVQVNGCLTVQASRVTISDSKIVCQQGRPALALLGRATGSVVRSVEIDGRGVAAVGIEAKNAVISQVNVHGTGDGVHLGRGVTLENSYIHDLADQPTLHHDDLQTLSGSAAANVYVLHNTLQAYTGTRQDNTVYHLGSGSISSIVVQDNFMDGGHYTVEVADGSNQHGIVFRSNHFGRHYHYGILLLGQKGTAVSLIGNVYQDSGSPATAANSRGFGEMQ